MCRLFFVILILLTFLLSNFNTSMAYEREISELSAAMAENVAKAGKKTIAVVDFTDLQGNVTELGRFLAEEFYVAIAGASKGFEVVDRTHLMSILVEHKLSTTGLIDPQTARKLGKIAGVEALVTGTITPFGDSVRLTIKILDTESAKVIDASAGNIAKTKAIEELLSRGVESGQSFATRSSSTGYASSPSSSKSKKYAIIEDSYFRISVSRVKKSGNKFVNINIDYENLTEEEITVSFGYGSAVLYDELGNESVINYSSLPKFTIPSKGKKNIGLGFKFLRAKKLGNIFSLNLQHMTNPPGPTSLLDIKID